MTETKLKKLLAQGSLNYYSKHIKVICESESQVGILRISISLYERKVLTDSTTIEGGEPDELIKEVKNVVERLKTKAYLNI